MIKCYIHIELVIINIKMSRPKWLAVGKHSTNYQTRSQLSLSKRQNQDLYKIQSSHHQPNRLSQLIFDTEGEIDSPLYKTSEDRNLSSDGDFGQMIGKRDSNRYLLKKSSDNILMSSQGETNYPTKHFNSGHDSGVNGLVINDRVTNQQMKERQRHLPVYMKQNFSDTKERDSPLIANLRNFYIQSPRDQQQSPEQKISQQPEQQSIILEEHQIGNDNHSQTQTQNNNYQSSRMQQLSVHESEEGQYNDHYQKQHSSDQRSEIIEAVSFVQQQSNSIHENHHDLQTRNMNVNYPSVMYQQASSMQVQPILFKNILSRLSYQKQDGGVSSMNQQSDRSWHSHKVKINLSKQHRFEDYSDMRQLQLQNKMSGNALHRQQQQHRRQQQQDSIRRKQMLMSKIRHKLNEVNQLNSQLKVIKETIEQEIKFCQSGGRMELFLWDRFRHDKLFLDLKQRFLTGIEKIVGERVQSELKLQSKKLQLKLSKPIISLSILPLKQSYINCSKQYKESVQCSKQIKESEQLLIQQQQKINKLQSELSISQLHCQSLTIQKQSLQQQLFTLHQQLIGVEMQIQQRVRKQLRQLQASLQTRIRQQLKPQMEQSVLASQKASCYIETIDTLTKQIQDLTNKCIHYQNYIMQHQQHNKQLQQQHIKLLQQQQNKQLQQQHNKQSHQQSITNQQHQYYDQLFIQKMAELQLKQQTLTQVQKQLLQMNANLKQVQAQLNNQQNLLFNRETLLASKEQEVDKAIEEINRKQQKLYQWQNQLQQEQNNINIKFNQLHLRNAQLPQQDKPNTQSKKKTSHHQYHTKLDSHQHIANSKQHIANSNQHIANSNQYIVSSPFFKYRDNKVQLPGVSFTQSMITQPAKSELSNVGYSNTNPSYNKQLNQLNKLYSNQYSPIPATHNSGTQSLSTKLSSPLANNYSTGNNSINAQSRGDKQSRQQFILQIKSKHRLQNQPTNHRQQLRQNKEEKFIPRKQGQVVNEMFTRSQVYSSTSNRPKSPIPHYNPNNQPHKQQRYTNTHSISIKDTSPSNYYKHDRSAVYNHKHDQYNSAHNTKKLSNSYQHLNYISSNNGNNINSIGINNINSSKINSHQSSLYSPKNSQYNRRPFNSTVSQNNKQTPLSSYSNRSFVKSPLPASTISQKLQKLKQQIKREVKQLE